MSVQPNVSEQLAGIRRLLEELVAPELGDSYVATQLRAVIEALAQLETQWQRAIPLLMRENDELGDLFGQLHPALAEHLSAPSELIDRIGAARATADRSASPYPVFSELEQRNRELRGLLVQTIEALAEASHPELERARGRIRETLKAGMERALGG